MVDRWPSFLSSPTRVLILHKNVISGLSKELKQGAIQRPAIVVWQSTDQVMLPSCVSCATPAIRKRFKIFFHQNLNSSDQIIF